MENAKVKVQKKQNSKYKKDAECNAKFRIQDARFKMENVQNGMFLAATTCATGREPHQVGSQEVFLLSSSQLSGLST